jgi:putative glutathione S-transferase
MGPFPHVEDYVEADFSELRVGGVKLPAVVEYQTKL